MPPFAPPARTAWCSSTAAAIWATSGRITSGFATGSSRRCATIASCSWPQSIHFDEPAASHRFAEHAARHPDFTLYVRDRPSLDIAKAWVGERARLAPDSAFALGAQRRPAAAGVPLLALMRSDGERRPHADAVPAHATIVDWLADDEAPPPGRDAAARQRQAGARLQRGLRLLARGERVVTDRLHGHILSLLLGIPHAVLDNRYGKVGAYIDAWTGGSPLLERRPDAAAPLPR
ncbi:polysaccharide pyruvyl transferase family protein [Sphingomonas adhaesiva]|uniref:polysaccharide pyruvyl transferase family protein n=1 Tax=Sphingomonas adhaesiva TaxID=28212 RepID=UPI003FA76136